MAKLLVSSYTAGPARVVAAAATMLPDYNVITLPSGYFFVGRMLRIIATGQISCVVTTPGTARYDVRLGGTVVWDSGAMPLNIVAKVNVPWFLELRLTCRAVGGGTAANLIGQGTWTSEAVIGSPLPTVGSVGSFTVPYNTAPVVGGGFNSTSALSLDMFFTQTVGTGSMTGLQYSVEQVDDF